MKKFLLRLLVFVVLVCLVLSPLFLFNIGGKNLKYINNSTVAFIDKMNAIKQMKSPKLIITGGSNAFYGMNSELIKDSVNYDVYNMALFAGFGVEFILKQIDQYVDSGDIVILNLEYFLKSDCNPKAIKDVIRYYPEAQIYFDDYSLSYFEEYKNKFKNNIESIQDLVLGPVKSSSAIYVHSREINKYGDAIGYLNYKTPKQRPLLQIGYMDYTEGIDLINSYALKYEKRKAHLYYIFPPVPLSTYEISSEAIERLYNDLKQELKVPILCEPREMVFEDSLFYDTGYHLNKDGRQMRTLILLEAFKEINKYQSN